MLDTSDAAERAQAAKAAGRLHYLIGKLDAGQRALPCELSHCFVACGYKPAWMFHLMACTAVAEKYRLADKPAIVADIMALHSARARLLAWGMRQNRPGVEQLYLAARRLQTLYLSRKSIGERQRRWRTADLDIVLCTGMAFSPEFGITPWVCQQPDLRYRWSEVGMVRLNYLASCWDAYAQCSFTPADRLIGLQDFPNHPDYCPTPCP